MMNNYQLAFDILIFNLFVCENRQIHYVTSIPMGNDHSPIMPRRSNISFLDKQGQVTPNKNVQCGPALNISEIL